MKKLRRKIARSCLNIVEFTPYGSASYVLKSLSQLLMSLPPTASSGPAFPSCFSVPLSSGDASFNALSSRLVSFGELS